MGQLFVESMLAYGLTAKTIYAAPFLLLRTVAWSLVSIKLACVAGVVTKTAIKMASIFFMIFSNELIVAI